MDEQKKFSSYSLPKQEIRTKDDALPIDNVDSNAESLSSADPFAEIEIDFSSDNASSSNKAMRFYETAAPSVPISQNSYDPTRTKFYEMRRLASSRPFPRDDSELFCRQAKFMVDFTDDYQDDVKFFMYYPNYQQMGYEQLRGYFTWRTRFRKGDIRPTSVSNVYLYAYELLNNIGVDSHIEGLNQMLIIWNNCLKFAPALETHFPGWFKDYHVYYNLPHSFADFAKENDLLRYYSATFLFDTDIESRFDLWLGISSYLVSRSKFYVAGNQQLFKDCFNAVLDDIDKLCGRNNIRIEDLLIYGVGKRTAWRPFKNAYFQPVLQQPDCKVEMPGGERYYCKNNRWSANLPVFFSTQKDFVGYLLKKTEACLREAVKYKYKIKAEPTRRYNMTFSELKRLENGRADLDSTIEKAVSDFHRNLNRTVVAVDFDNLARIRKEAQGTQEKLIIPESDFGSELPNVDTRLESDARNSGFGDKKMEDAPDLKYTVISVAWDEEAGDNRFSEQRENGWVLLKDALSSTELEALGLLIRGDAGIKTFAYEKGIMPELLADSINDKSTDAIGDSILEMVDEMTIFDEYKDEVARLLR